MFAVCSTSPAAVATPSPSVGKSAPTFTPRVSPSPEPAQRAEPALPAAIEESAAAAANGKLYVMGGFNAAGASLDGVYVFDGKAWSAGPHLPLPVDHPSAATLDGVVYIAGGHSNGADTARTFRLDGDHWTEMSSMHFARGGHALVAVEGRLYAIGGNTSRANVAQVETFDPGANAWTSVASLPVPRNHVMGFVLGAAACVAGGRSPTTARIDCMNVSSAEWSRLPDLPSATSGGGAATFVGGGVVVTGGEDANENRMIDQLTRYQPGGSWSSGDTMLSPRHGFELAAFQGRAWACGGGTAPGLNPVTTCTSLGNPAPSNRGK
jgi:non-specific serine/threonine protein kinase